jgi:hypothetical protein
MKKRVSFKNLPSQKILKIHHLEEGALLAVMQFSGNVYCCDPEKSRQLLLVGRDPVKLYNVKVINDDELVLHEHSGIRTEPSIPRIRTKWNCLYCNCKNYANVSVCFSCDRTRMEGPEGPLWLFKNLKGPPYHHETWNCKSCHARKNSFRQNDCWKCGGSKK